jgi:hypothetical protein
MVEKFSGVSRWAAPALATLVLLTGSACTAGDNAPQPPVSSAPTTADPNGAASPAPGTRETPRSTLPPPPTTPVPQETPGDVNSTVPTKPEKSEKPVGLDEASTAEGGVVTRIARVRSLTTKAKGPGEVSGPGLAVTVEARNSSSSAVSLDQVVVNLTGADGVPGNPMSDRPAKPFRGQLAAGKKATGVYVFNVEEDNRDPVNIEVTISGGATVLVFSGPA